MFSRTQLLVAHAEKMTRTAGSRIAVRAIPLIGKSPSRRFDGRNLGRLLRGPSGARTVPVIDSIGPTALHGSARRKSADRREIDPLPACPVSARLCMVYTQAM